MSDAHHLTAGDHADAALMLRVQAGEQEAFGALYDRFGARAYQLASSVDRASAEDVVAEAFLSMWRGRARFRPEDGTVTAWVMGIVRERAIDAVCPPGRRDRGERLRGTLTKLPAAQREIIELAYFGELSSAQIAERLEIPIGTVKGRMRLGLDKLDSDGTP